MPRTMLLLTMALTLSQVPCSLAAVSSPPLGQKCHLENAHTRKTAGPEKLTGHCKAWGNNACCTAKTESTISNLYGEKVPIAERCGVPSAKCQAWFVAEACMYECDVNAGRFRHHTGCSPSNKWQMAGMPIRASECDAWAADCADDYFCFGTADYDGNGSPSFFEVNAKCNSTGTGCRKLKDIYPKGGKDVCEKMWASGNEPAFLYETDELRAFTFVPDHVNASNPNDAVMPHAKMPREPLCPPYAQPSALLLVVKRETFLHCAVFGIGSF